jgi:hypothetical protein
VFSSDEDGDFFAEKTLRPASTDLVQMSCCMALGEDAEDPRDSEK